MNRGLLLWLGLAVVLGALSAAVVRTVVRALREDAPPPVVSAPARAPPPAPRPTPEPALAPAAPQPGLVALPPFEPDRREARLSRRLRRLADEDPQDVRAEEPARAPVTPVVVDAGAPIVADAGVVTDAGFASDAGSTIAASAAPPERERAPTARVRVVVADENRAWLKLVSVDVEIDHQRVVSRADSSGITFNTDEVAFEGPQFSGSHFVEATFVYQGAGGVFGYLEGYSLRAKGRQDIAFTSGATTTLIVRSVDRGAIYELEKRPQVVIKTE